MRLKVQGQDEGSQGCLRFRVKGKGSRVQLVSRAAHTARAPAPAYTSERVLYCQKRSGALFASTHRAGVLAERQALCAPGRIRIEFRAE